MLTIIQSQFATNDGSSTLQLPKKLVLRLHSNDSMGYEQRFSQAAGENATALATGGHRSSSGSLLPPQPMLSQSFGQPEQQQPRKRSRPNASGELESADLCDNPIAEVSELAGDATDIGVEAAHATANATDMGTAAAAAAAAAAADADAVAAAERSFPTLGMAHAEIARLNVENATLRNEVASLRQRIELIVRTLREHGINVPDRSL
eukprot:gene17458-20067_t